MMAERGVTQAELARRLGVSRHCVTRFLNSTEKTSVYQLVRFARALGMEVQLSVAPDSAGPVSRQAPALGCGGGASPEVGPECD